MCTFRDDLYVCDAPECAALGLDRLAVVRRRLAAWLIGVSDACLIDVLVAVDEMLSCTFTDPRPALPRPARVQVQRRPRNQGLWVEVSGCSEEIARASSTSLRSVSIPLLILDNLCTAWGVVPGESTRTMWAELPLELEEPRTS